MKRFLLLILFMGASSLMMYALFQSQLSTNDKYQRLAMNQDVEREPEDESAEIQFDKSSFHPLKETLEEKLQRISTKDKEVIITTATGAFTDFFLNWYCSARKWNAHRNVLVYTVDEKFAKDLVHKYGVMNVYWPHEEAGDKLHAKKDLVADVTKEFRYRTLDYQKLMVQRTNFINHVLLMGYKILLVDNDAVWFGNPLTYIRKKYSGVDLIAQNDVRNPNTEKKICGCLIYLNSTAATLQLWQNVTTRHAKAILEDSQISSTEQEILNNFRNKHDLKIEYLPNNLFPSGFEYFKGDKMRSKYPDSIVIHNNWIVGHDKKKERFIKHNLWYITENKARGLFSCQMDLVNTKSRP